MTAADYLRNFALLILAGGGAFIAWIFTSKAWRVEIPEVDDPDSAGPRAVRAKPNDESPYDDDMRAES